MYLYCYYPKNYYYVYAIISLMLNRTNLYINSHIFSNILIMYFYTLICYDNKIIIDIGIAYIHLFKINKINLIRYVTSHRFSI